MYVLTADTVVALPLVENAVQKYCHKAQHQERENRPDLQPCCMLNPFHSNIPLPVENRVLHERVFQCQNQSSPMDEGYNKIQVIKQIKSTSKTRWMTRGNHLHVKKHRSPYSACGAWAAQIRRAVQESPFDKCCPLVFRTAHTSRGSKSVTMSWA